MTSPDDLEEAFYAALLAGDREGVKAALMAIGEAAPDRLERLLDIAYPRPAGGYPKPPGSRAVDYMGDSPDRLGEYLARNWP